MSRKVLTNFNAGMVTDIIGAEGSVQRLHDMFVARGGEVVTRGGIRGVTTALNVPTNHYESGISDIAFHPNFGAGYVRAHSATAGPDLGDAAGYQLVAMPLMDSSALLDAEPDFTANLATSGAAGTQNEVYLDHASATNPFELCLQHAILPNEIVFAGYLGSLYKWGGSSLDDYNTGTVATTEGSREVVGSGTSWGTNVEEGQYILIDGVGEKTVDGHQRAFRITYVVDDTHLEVDYPMAADLSGRGYRIVSVAAVQSPPGVWNPVTERPHSMGIVAFHQGRLFVACPSDDATDYETVFNLDRIRWSGNQNDVMVDADTETGFHHIDLWRSGGYIDVSPGVGGAIRGLVSMGDELVVIKTHGMFRLVGTPALSGGSNNLNVQLQLIADGPGANGPKAFALCKRGLVVASQDGLYLYDGQTVKSLTDNRIQRWWDENLRSSTYTVTAFDDKVIVSPWVPTQDGVVDNNLVWDIEKDIFFSMSAMAISAGCALYTADDEYVNDVVVLQRHDVQSLTSMHYVGGMMRAAGTISRVGMLDSYHGSSSGVTPVMDFMTHPIPLGSDACKEGRANTLDIHCRAGINGGVDVYLVDGHWYDEIVSAPQDLVEELTSLAGCDRVRRIPVDSHGAVPSTRVQLTVPAQGFVGSFFLYGIAIDYTESTVVDN